MTVADCIEWLSETAPPELAEEWDNVGLLLGERESDVRRVMTCLTLTSDVAREAVDEEADLIVTHHPVLFRPVQRLTGETAEGRLLLELIREEVSVYSPHTAFDSARAGINQQLAESLGLLDVVPLRPVAPGAADVTSTDVPVGGGRRGSFDQPVPLDDVLRRCQSVLPAPVVQYVGNPARLVSSLAVACGAAGEFIPDALAAGCDALLTGEARFHACLEAREAGLVLILAGHFASERPGVERLAAMLGAAFPDLMVWASRVESDPVQWRLM